MLLLRILCQYEFFGTRTSLMKNNIPLPLNEKKKGKKKNFLYIFSITLQYGLFAGNVIEMCLFLKKSLILFALWRYHPEKWLHRQTYFLFMELERFLFSVHLYLYCTVNDLYLTSNPTSTMTVETFFLLKCRHVCKICVLWLLESFPLFQLITLVLDHVYCQSSIRVVKVCNHYLLTANECA